MRIGEYNPQYLEEQGVAILTMNHVGSTVGQDTGRDAQYMADNWGVPTFAINRPGTGLTLPRAATRDRLATSYAAEFEPIATDLAELFDEREIKDIVVVSRSAAVVSSLAIATSGILPIRAIYGAEGVGWSNMSVEQGKMTYKSYMTDQARLLDNDEHSDQPRLVHPEGTGLGIVASVGRIASIPPALIIDQYNSQKVWASDLATQYLKILHDTATSAKDAGGPAVYLDFAEYSLTEIAVINDAVRRANPEADIQVVPNTVHASFDKRPFFAGRAQRAVDHIV